MELLRVHGALASGIHFSASEYQRLDARFRADMHFLQEEDRIRQERETKNPPKKGTTLKLEDDGS